MDHNDPNGHLSCKKGWKKHMSKGIVFGYHDGIIEAFVYSEAQKLLGSFPIDRETWDKCISTCVRASIDAQEDKWNRTQRQMDVDRMLDDILKEKEDGDTPDKK